MAPVLGLVLVCLTAVLGSNVFTGEMPQFIEEPESQVVRPRSKVILRCRVSPPLARIRWKFNGDFIGTNYQEGIIINESGDLVIRSFRHSKKHQPHAGRYQCVAQTPSGAIASRTVRVEKSFIKEFRRTPIAKLVVNVTLGNTALIPCAPPLSQPRSEISFLVNQTIVQDGHSGRHTVLPSGNLQIGDVRFSDQGHYECQAYNPVREQYRTSEQIVTLLVTAPTRPVPARTIYAAESMEAVQGSNVTLECVSTGNPIPNVQWSMFGGVLPKSRHDRQLGNLILHDLKPEDTGTYICHSANQHGTQTNHTFLKVLEPPRIKVPPQNHKAVQADTVTFDCEARGSGKVKTSWLFNGKPVYRGPTIAISETTMTLSEVQPAQTGFYQCVAESKFGWTSAVATLQVRPRKWNSVILRDNDSTTRPQAIAPDYLQGPSSAEEPVIGIGPSNATVSTGQSVTLLCVTRNEAKISWLKDGRVITHIVNKRHEIRADGSLVIDDVQSGDSGIYKCVASNSVGLTTARAYLQVTADRQSLYGVNTGPSQIPPTRKGAPSVKKFTTTPNPEDRLYNTQNVTDTPRRKRPTPPPPDALGPLGTFGIQDTEETEEGGALGGPIDGGRPDRGRPDRGRARGGRRRKKKKKKKSKKKKNRKNEEVIMVPPSQPRVSQLDDIVVLEWVVPNNNGLRISFFRVQYKMISSRGGRRWGTIDAEIRNSVRRYEIKGLDNGKYRFRIVAVYENNDNKFGDNSKRFEVGRGRHVPADGPFIVDATVSPSAISIRWKKPKTRGLVIEGYHIYFKPYKAPDSDFDRRELQGDRSDHYIITNLSPDTQYEIKMQLYNQQGVSKFSNTVVKKTTALGKNPLYPYDIDDPALGATDGTLTYDDQGGYVSNKTNTHNSNKTLYMVLGIVLGLMMLLLVIFMITCGCKQRQQRRMLAANESTLRGKHTDSSHRIHGDNIRKKYMNNGFVLNGLSTPGGYPNGTLCNGYPNGTLQSHQSNHGSKINISVNPMTHVDSGNLDGNENEKVQTNGDIMPNFHHIINPNVTDGIYNSLQRNMNRHQFPIIMDHNSPFPESINRMDTFPAMNRARAASTFKPEPTDPNKIHNRNYDHLNHHGPYDHVYRSHDQLPTPYEHLQNGMLHDQSFMSEPPPPPLDSPTATVASNHSHRRRHRRHHNNLNGPHRERSHSSSGHHGPGTPSRDGARTPMRDMSTNTDFANTGPSMVEQDLAAMEQQSMTYRSLDTLRREEMMNHRRSPIVYPDIPQVHDYSDYNLEEPDLP